MRFAEVAFPSFLLAFVGLAAVLSHESGAMIDELPLSFTGCPC